jgi:dihydrolipoamide dehydrogenase
MDGAPGDEALDHAAPVDERFTVAVIGGGSAAEALLRALAGSDHRPVVFEPGLVGGECPFLACMPSKTLLHDARVGTPWRRARARRDEVTAGLDDSEHVVDAERLGATVVRSAATLVDAHHVATGDGRRFRVDHVVIATGAEPVIPEIPGLDPGGDRVWTSDDALTSTELPRRLAILGGGVIGSELARLFSGFGTSVTVLDEAPRPLADLHPRIGDLVVEHLTARDVDVRSSTAARAVRCRPDGVEVDVGPTGDADAPGDVVRADRLVVAVGRRPRRSGLGLERLGLDPVRVAPDHAGRLPVEGSIWMAGDVAGLHQYTHVANHHAAVVADHLAGPGTRRFDDAVVPACVFVDPPVMTVGPSRAALADDDDVVWADVELDVARRTTDALGAGFLSVGARRSTGCLVAAHGLGARFDELVHAFVVAIDGAVPVGVLRRSIRPFPTVGEVLDVALDDLAARFVAG